MNRISPFRTERLVFFLERKHSQTTDERKCTWHIWETGSVMSLEAKKEVCVYAPGRMEADEASTQTGRGLECLNVILLPT